MKTVNRFPLIALVAAAGLLMAAFAVSGVPEGKEVLKIDRIAGDEGAVEFHHAKHVAEYKAMGKDIKCMDCHHTAKTEDDAEACTKCHVAEGEAQVEVDGKKARFVAVKDPADGSWDTGSVIFHATCKDGCHKDVRKAEGKKITSCKVCHASASEE